MSELFPMLAGVCIGFVMQWSASPRLRIVALCGLSILAGFTASFISGELFVSWDFLFVDIPLVLVAALATTFVLNWQRSRWLSN